MSPRQTHLTTRDLLMMAALAALGGVASTYVNAAGDLVQSILGFVGTTQWAAGLHVLWLTLAKNKDSLLHRNGIVLTVAALLVLGGLGACGTESAPTVPTEGGPVVLTIVGKVDNELNLTRADIQGRDMVTVTTRHPRHGEDDYEGLRLNDLLKEAGVQSGATLLLVTSASDTVTKVSLADVAACPECLISLCESGNLRLVMPGMPTEAWVGQVVSIKVQ